MKSSHHLSCCCHQVTGWLVPKLRTTDFVVLKWVESNCAIGSHGIGCHVKLFSAHDDEVGFSGRRCLYLTTGWDLFDFLGYQTMQFRIGNPTNQFSTWSDDAMRSYCVRNFRMSPGESLETLASHLASRWIPGEPTWQVAGWLSAYRSFHLVY